MRFTLVLLAVALTACGARQPPPADPAPVSAPPPPAIVRVVTETVTVRDPDLEREAARLKMSLLERSAQLADATRQLDQATTDVVRAMARLRSVATRAEAASAIAEAEVTIQQLRGGAGGQAPPEARQAEAALRAASGAFDAANYGGAVYLATQAKRVATAGRGRLAQGGSVSRAGERTFVVPVQITTTARANLRSAPRANADLVTTVAAGTTLTAYAWAQDWMRVTLPDGRVAWVHQALVRGVAPGGP
ncbi:MAG TPA: SH3 domain-containing protein [Gemmatimonadales bacterium]|nr:SH3 domain-containing protein [Gemmatimonadales bacterium]